MEKLIDFIENHPKDSFSQSPVKYFNNHNLSEYIHLINPSSIKETKKNIFKFVYGKVYCKNCNLEITEMKSGWQRGWKKTCSEECRQNLASKRMLGDKNSYHKLSEFQKLELHNKQSIIMKDKIRNGYTPKSSNYRGHKDIIIKINNKIVSVRSLWEVIFWIFNPELEYEKIRIKYFDNKLNKNRIYITDFYEVNSNTIYEVKPSSYHYQLKDKIIGVNNTNYKFQIIDESYFKDYTFEEIKDKVNQHLVYCKNIETRLIPLKFWTKKQ